MFFLLPPFADNTKRRAGGHGGLKGHVPNRETLIFDELQKKRTDGLRGWTWKRVDGMQKTAGRRYTQQGGPAGFRKGGPPGCRLRKRAARRDEHLKLAKVIVFMACGSCNERPAPAALLHKPSDRLNMQPAGQPQHNVFQLGTRPSSPPCPPFCVIPVCSFCFDGSGYTFDGTVYFCLSFQFFRVSVCALGFR